MLGLAIGLERTGFGLLAGVGGFGMALTVLCVALVLLVVSPLIERRHDRIARSRRLWELYALNDQFTERAHAQRLIRLGYPALEDEGARLPRLNSRLGRGRWGGPPGNN